MNLATAIVLGVVAAAVVAALAFLVHRARPGGSSACSACALKGLCRK